jgi:ribosome maturation factor RimP
VERDITLPWHIEALTGERVEARLFAPLDGSRVIVGVLGGLDDGKVLINKDGTDVAVPYEAISKMKLLFDFSNI